MNGEKVRSVRDLREKVMADPELRERLMQEPEAVLKSLEELPVETQGWIYIGVISVLGAVVLAAVIGGIVLAASGTTIPDGLIALGSTALGGLVGLLSRSPQES